MAPEWLTPRMAMAMHAQAIALVGGSAGIRDQGLLESALDRPRNLAAYGDSPGIFDLAAAYCVGIVKNHPFIDGNKRTAFAAAYTFLAINGAQLTADSEEAYAFISGLYEAGTFGFDKLVPWLRRNVKAGA